MPPLRYDFVRTGLEYVPFALRPAYLQHLLDQVVAPGGRLIVGVHNLAKNDPLAQDLARWGHQVAGVSRAVGPAGVCGRRTFSRSRQLRTR